MVLFLEILAKVTFFFENKLPLEGFYFWERNSFYSLKTFSRVKLCSDACKIESSFNFLHEIMNAYLKNFYPLTSRYPFTKMLLGFEVQLVFFGKLFG